MTHTLPPMLEALAATLASYPDWDAPPEPPPGLGPIAGDWISWARWVAALAGFIGLVVAAVKMYAGQSNRSNMAAQGAGQAVWVIAGLSLVTIAGAVVSGILG